MLTLSWLCIAAGMGMVAKLDGKKHLVYMDVAAVIDKKARFHMIGIPDTYVSIVGEQKYLLECYGLSHSRIAEHIEKVMKE